MKHSNWPVYDTPRPQALLAKITNRREHHNRDGSHVCTVGCPECGAARTLSYGGWSAVACAGCGSTLYRNRRSMESDNA